MEFTPTQRERYHRQMRLPGMGDAGQERLANARVLLIGAGGLGAPAALYLTAAGVGNIGIAERDHVELSNLHRQVLFSETDLNQPKLKVTQDRLISLNSDLKFHAIKEGIHPGNAVDLVSQYDMVLDGSDNFGTRYLVNDACRLSGVAHLHGGIERFSGIVTLFDPAREDSPCYRCLFPHSPNPGDIPSCAEAGVLGPLTGIVGSMMAMEALKWILAIGDPLIGKIWHYDALTSKSRIVRVKRSSHCPVCGNHPEIQSIQPETYQGLDPLCNMQNSSSEEISVQELAERLPKKDFILLDVREDDEVALCCIQGNTHIPLKEVSIHCVKLDPNQEYIVYCHHGGRSLKAVRLLRSKGFSKAYSLKGGIERWACEIDTTLARY